MNFGMGRSGAAGTFGTAASATGAEVDAAVQLEAVLMKIHLDRLGFFQKFRVDDEFKTVNVKLFVRISKLIQSHGQAGTPSAAFIQKNADGFYIFSLEIFGNLVNCRLCDLKHNALLGNDKNGLIVIDAGNPQLASVWELNHVHQVCQSQNGYWR
jgi:hypothetical protein